MFRRRRVEQDGRSRDPSQNTQKESPTVAQGIDQAKIEAILVNIEETLKARLAILEQLLQKYFSTGEGKEIVDPNSRNFVEGFAKWKLFRLVIDQRNVSALNARERTRLLQTIEGFDEITFRSVSVPNRYEIFDLVSNHKDADFENLSNAVQKLTMEALRTPLG